MTTDDRLDPPPHMKSVMYDAIDAIEASVTAWRFQGGRGGGRGYITVIVRRLVAARDNYRCTVCGDSGPDADLQFDHLIPWSAGGRDTSDNLRLLCQPCNHWRSNRTEVFYPRLLPVTEICDPCWIEHNPDYEQNDARIAAWCGVCTATSWVSDLRYLL